MNDPYLPGESIKQHLVEVVTTSIGAKPSGYREGWRE